MEPIRCGHRKLGHSGAYPSSPGSHPTTSLVSADSGQSTSAPGPVQPRAD